MRSVNRALQLSPLGLLSRVKQEVERIAKTLGVCDSVPAAFLQRMKDRKTSDMEIPVQEIEALIAERAEARKAKNFKRSDEIRDLLDAKNIVLLDGAQGTTWKVK